MIHLSLTQQEAEVLAEILSLVAGSPFGARGIADDIKEKLYTIGVYSTFDTEEKYPATGRIKFV